MSDPNGPQEDMSQSAMRDPLHLDDNTLERLLDGMLVDDAPPRYRAVALVLRELSAPPMWSELGDDRTALAAIARDLKPRTPIARATSTSTGTRTATAGTRPSTRSKTRPRRRLRTITAVLVGSAVLFVGLGAAGALPGPAQDVAHDVLDAVGVDSPTSHGNGGSTSGITTGATTNSNGKGGTISSLTHDPAISSDGNGKGSTVCDVASEGQCNAGDPPGATNPNRGGTSDTAGQPDKAGSASDDNPSATAPTPTTGGQGNGKPDDVDAEDTSGGNQNKP